jgi:type I restriction enzyme S subunit
MKAVATKQGLPHGIDSPAVPPGYKQTDLGIIPEHWHIRQLVDICMPQGIVRGPFGGMLKKDTFVTSGFKVYEQQNAIYKSSEIGSYFVDRSKYAEMHRFSVSPGDFIISCSGTIGRIFQIPPDAPQGVINQALLKLTTDDEVVYDRYFYILFEWDKFQIRIIDSTQGGAMKNLVGMDVFRTITVVLPPLSEQRAIAEALSDVDGLLNALEALIAKKRAIKQATMQQLLTGKTRLPGFSGAWETKRLGELAHIKTGGRNNEDKVKNGEYPFFVRSAIVERINSYCFDGEAILVPGEGGIGSIFHYINGRFDCHQRVYMINRFVDDVCGKLIYYSMVLQFGSHAMQNTVKATVDSLRLPTFKNFSFSMPKDIAEQQAIASVLSNMDSEIDALEQRRDKTRAIKQGMMQQLLTGRVRLSESRIDTDDADDAD